MRVVALIVAALLLVATPALFAADTAVGTISSLSGTVEIDAFGKGAFIAAMRGDRIYDSSVLRTGPHSGATDRVAREAQPGPAGHRVPGPPRRWKDSAAPAGWAGFPRSSES